MVISHMIGCVKTNTLKSCIIWTTQQHIIKSWGFFQKFNNLITIWTKHQQEMTLQLYSKNPK